MNPSGFFSSEQLDFIFKEAVSYYENNKFTILTQPVTNKILIMLLEALRKDLQYYFNEDYVAKFLQQIALEFKSKAMITDPNRWNPYLANQQRNPDYDPYFITNINAEKIKLEDAVQQFEGLLDQSALDGLLISALQTTVPKEISSLLSAIYKYVKNGFIEMYQDAKAMLQTFADLPEMYNAFLVGLYNGLIRFLASLIEMVGFFVSLANPGNWESFVEGFKKFFSEFWSTLKTLIAAYFKKFTNAQNPVDFIKIFVEEITGIAIELFLLYVSVGASAAKKLAEGLERLLKNPKATVEDWMDYFKKRKKEEGNNKPIEKVIDDTEKLIIAKNMWDEFEYKHLLKIPPSKKPCFLAGTLVKTEKGLVAIEKIEQGLKVLSYNFENQKTEYQTVLQTFSNYAEKYIEIHTETEQLKVTGAHLFYIPSDKKWIAASQLKLDMQLIDAQQNLVSIKNLEIIKEEVQTYNMEVAQNHNYYVGEQQSILTHNDSKKLKFTSEIIYEFNFYEYYDVDNKPTYVGQTTQELTKRADQHTQDYKKHPQKKQFIGVSETLPKEIRINGIKGPHKMTPFESALTEMYELNVRGGKRVDNKGLFNKKNPVSESSFKRIRKDFPNFNPCRFYV